MSYAVNQRTREMGIRMAVGAARRDVLRLVVGHGMKLAGRAFWPGSARLSPARASSHPLLYGLSPADPIAFAGTAVLLLAVALTACYLPARRAARIDPMVALRDE